MVSIVLFSTTSILLLKTIVLFTTAMIGRKPSTTKTGATDRKSTEYLCFEKRQPMHYSGYIDKFQYKIPYIDLFGGIVAFTAEIFEKINGYSNEYWGWGGEDDDLFRKGSSRDF